MTLSRWSEKWLLLRAFARARWGYRFATRAALLAWQKRRIERYLRGPLGEVGYYRNLERRSLSDLPVIDKAQMLACFAGFNRCALTAEVATEFALRAEAGRNFQPTLPGGITVGLSSGTSGRRGLFLVGPRERALWAGTILARTLAPASLCQVLNPFAPRLRIGLFLRANSNLYATIRSSRVHFQFFDLLRTMTELLRELGACAPHVLVAPASILRALADAQLAGQLEVRPRQVISVAEVLEPDDEQVIQQAWGRRPAQVYQCTEGLLGQSCEAGSIHLNEEFVHFEPLWLDAKQERFIPLVTDFSRAVQVFARYRLDDVLRVNPAPCPCGRMTLRLSAIEGRSDDILWLPGSASAALQPVFPDVLRRAIAVANLEIADYRIEQHGAQWELRIRESPDGDRAREGLVAELNELCLRFGWQPPRFVFLPWIDPARGAKRRRISCLSRPCESDACVS